METPGREMTPIELRNRTADFLQGLFGSSLITYDDPIMGLPRQITVKRLVDSVLDDCKAAGAYTTSPAGQVIVLKKDGIGTPGTEVVTGCKRLLYRACDSMVNGRTVALSWGSVARLVMSLAERENPSLSAA